MKAVIMAGGEGTRLRPLTSVIPKPMVPIVNRPVMEHIINLLRKHNIKDIASTLYYLPSSIMDYFGSGEDFGVNLHYFIEETPLGTGGSVLNTGDFLDSTFIIISGDAMTDINIDKVLEFHRVRKSRATLVLKKVSVPLEYGIVITDESGKILRFLEKPGWGEVFSDTANTGIYILEPEVLSYYKKGDVFDFSRDLFPKLLRDNVPMYGYVTNEYWCDIGDLQSYKETNFGILKNIVNIERNYKEISPGIFAGCGSIISSTAVINPPVIIGNNCSIGDNSLIDSFTVIGDNCSIGEKSSIKRSILWNGCRIGKSVQCRGTVICNKVEILDGSNIFENSVIGPECHLSKRVTVKPDIKIWPAKKLEEETIISKNLVWGTRALKTLFGNRGISGTFNTEITPELVSLIGSAFASVIKKGGPIVVSSDGSPVSSMLKSSMLCGITSPGKGAINIEDVPLPVSRYAVMFFEASGGVHISCNPTDKEIVNIEFLNYRGGNIDRNTEKKIEHLYLREDFERSNSNMIKDVVNIDNFLSLYIMNNSTTLKNMALIKNQSPSVLLASLSDSAAAAASSILREAGCRVQVDYSVKNYKSIEEYIPIMTKLVMEKRVDMGALISSSGEDLILIDCTGRVIDGEKYRLLASIIVLKSGPAKSLVVPYTTTMVIEEIAGQYGCKIVRSKQSTSNIMNEMLKETDEGNFLLQYVLNFDGILALAKIVDYLAGSSKSLRELVDEIPVFHIEKREINCDFNNRGRILRQLIEESSKDNMELFEGVKINTDKGWVLVLPDNERPVFNIYTEGFSEEYAEELSDMVLDKIRTLMNNKEQTSERTGK